MKRPRSVFFPPVVLDPQAQTPLYRQLYIWFRRAIVDGGLRPGQRLPSTRALAAELSLSRITVLNAFEQLHAEGYLEGRVGAGTFVTRSIPDEMHRPAANPLAARLLRATGSAAGATAASRRISSYGAVLARQPPEPWLNKPVAFRVSLPALDHFPFETWSRLTARHSRRPAARDLGYGDPMGRAGLRQAIAEYLRTVRAARCEAENIMVVTGSQQGLQIAARVLLDPGSRVWMEDPGYPGARQALRVAGAELVPVPVDDEGLDVAAGIARCPDARAVYATPSHQYPLGMTMSATRRMQLLNWAARAGAWIIEDDYDSEHRFASRPVASLQGLDADARVIYIGTFSKVLYPALRLGYVVVPTDLIRVFAAAREESDIFSATLHQAVLTDFINEGHFARHIRRMRMLYMERCEALVTAARAHLGDGLEITHAEAGMHLVGLMPPGIDDAAVSRAAAANGVSAMPLSACYLTQAPRGGLILGYGGVSAVEIRAGVRKLAATLARA